jgi:hypothetical protein
VNFCIDQCNSGNTYVRDLLDVILGKIDNLEQHPVELLIILVLPSYMYFFTILSTYFFQIGLIHLTIGNNN